MNSGFIEQDNDHFCLADLTQLFSMCIAPEGKIHKSKESKASVRNAGDRFMACIHVELLEFKHEIAVTGMSTKVLIGSEKLSPIESKSDLEN